MKVSCPSCQTNYNIDDKRIPPGGAKLKCAKCQTTFPIKPPSEATAPAAIPLPGTAAPQSAAIPLPGSAAPQSAAIPLPGTAAPRSAAIPLPGSAAPQSAAIPLPGSAPPVPAPQADPFAATGGGQYVWDEEESTRVVAIATLPSAAYREPPPPEPTTSPASPAYAQQAYAQQEMPGTAGDFDLSTQTAAEPYSPDQHTMAGHTNPYVQYDPSQATQAAIPLPGSADPYAMPMEGQDTGYGEAIPLPGSADPNDPFALPPPPAAPEGYDDQSAYTQMSAPLQEDPFALPPPPAAPEGYDDQSAYTQVSAPPQEDPFALPPPPQEDPFALPPPLEGVPLGDDYAAPPPTDQGFALPEMQPPPTEVAPAHGFAFPPPPAAGPADPDPFAAVDLSEPPPATAPDLNLDFSSPPPPAPQAAPPPPANFNVGTDFGDVSFDDPAPPSAAPASVDALEFDPTAPARPSAGDDLEVDLSAPLPPPPSTGTADALEMLSFIDDAAKDSGAKAAGKVKRFHVRRRSGKVFGPFEEGVIVKMLEEGQLLGNEDVSTDSDNWTPIGTVASFAAAIQRLMEGPSSKTGLPAVAPSSEPAHTEQPPAPSANASLDRMKQLYEGRMASIAVVDRTSSYEKWRKRMPMIIGASVGVLLLLIGASFGFTRYGAFGFRKLFPARVSAGSPEFASVETARKALTQDSFRSYEQARDLTAKVLATREYPEVRAIWCQSIYYLQRRFAAAKKEELARCQDAREAFELLGVKNLEALKAMAGGALYTRQVDPVLPDLRDAYSREANSADLELAFLLAEAHAFKRQDKEAVAVLEKVLKTHKDSAKAWHMLGSIHQEAGRAEEAAKAYEAAFKADPTHVISGLEQAAVELLLLKGDPSKAMEALARVMDEKSLAELGPAEIARARGLKGVALAAQFKLKEAEAELQEALKQDADSSFVKAQLARVLRANRDYPNALPLYEALSKEQAGNIEYTEGYISALLTLGKMADAHKAVAAANSRFTNDARIALLTARIEDARDQLSAAEDAYKRAIKADDKLFEANLYLGRFYLRLRRNSEARVQLEQAAQKAPEDAGVRAGLGELALTENKLELAQQELEKAAQLNPSLAEAYLGLSRVALLNGDLEKANANSSKALELDPHLLKDGRLQRGTVLWRLGKLDEAIAELEKAKDEDPRSVTTPITLGAVLYEKGDYPNAEKNLSLALTREPSNHEALYYLALVKAKRSEYSGAIEQMRLAVDKAPKRSDYRYALGDIYRRDDRLGEAIEEWKKTLELDPNNADAHEALGHVYLDTGKVEDAIKSLEAALTVDPKRKRVLGAMGDAFFSAGRWDEAVRRYEKALREAPELTYVYYKIGRSWSERDQHTRAIDWYKKAIVAEPQNAMAYYYLGYSYKDKFKKKEAAAAFRKYLELKPNADDKSEIEDEIAALD